MDTPVRSRRPPLTGRQRLLRAALIGLTTFGVTAGYSWWLVYRAGVACKRLLSCQARVVRIAHPFDDYIVSVLPTGMWETWFRFRATEVRFDSVTAEAIPPNILVELQHLPFLTTVILGKRPFNPHHLAQMTAAQQIRELDLSEHGRRISDDAIDAIVRLRRLRILRLTSSCLTDDGIARLAKLRQLEELDIRWSHCISQAAVDQLAIKLPNCEIAFAPPQPFHRYTCPNCGFAINLRDGDWAQPPQDCWKCPSREPLLVQRNFNICHPVVEHKVTTRTKSGNVD